MTSGVVVFLVSSSFAIAQPVSAPPACTLGGLSNGCQFFEENKNKSEFVLPDGSRFGNPYFKAETQMEPASPPRPSEASLKQMQDSAKALQDMEDATLEAQAALLARGDLAGTDRFRLALTSKQSLVLLAWVFRTYHDSAEGSYEATLRLPWPPPEHDQLQWVKVSELKTRYLQKLSPGARDELQRQAERLDQAIKKVRDAAAPLPTSSPIAPPRTSIEEHNRRAKALFEKTQTMLLQEILRGRKPNALSPEESIMYEKVKSVSLKGVLSSSDSLACSAGAAGAFYNPASHSVSLCEGIMSFPESQLVAIFGHELGHAIDPCNCHNHLVRPQVSAFQREPSEELSRELSADAEKNKLYSGLRLMVQDGNQITSVPQTGLPPKLQEWAEQSGLLEPVVGAVPAGRYPQESTLNCLMNQGGLRDLPDAEVREMARLERRRAESAVGMKFEPAERIEYEQTLTDQLMRQPRACLRSFSHMESNRSELMADVWGSRVLGRYLEANPPKTQLERLAAISFFAPAACAGQRNSGELQHSATGHLLNRERIDLLFLADPRTQKAMGCAPSPSNGTACLQRQGGSSSGSAGGARSGQR